MTESHCDANSAARFIAYRRSTRMDRGEMEEALRREKEGDEPWVISGLLENPWLGDIARELTNAMEVASPVHDSSGSARQ
jgi:hypothetical protein